MAGGKVAQAAQDDPLIMVVVSGRTDGLRLAAGAALFSRAAGAQLAPYRRAEGLAASALQRARKRALCIGGDDESL